MRRGWPAFLDPNRSIVQWSTPTAHWPKTWRPTVALGTASIYHTIGTAPIFGFDWFRIAKTSYNVRHRQRIGMDTRSGGNKA